MNAILKIFLLTLSVFIIGCASTEPLGKPNAIFLPPPASLLIYCDSVKPPNRIQYPFYSPQKKEEVLTDMVMQLQKSLFLCQQQIFGINLWVDKMTAGSDFLSPLAIKKELEKNTQ